MNDIPTYLKQIITHKYAEVAERSVRISVADIEAGIANQIERGEVPRQFVEAIQKALTVGQSAVIAEVKKASPSKGILRENFVPSEIARSYEMAGASCLSVITDIKFFNGTDAYLEEARGTCSLPVIRKDFIVDPYQILESRLLGADCILLIAAALDDYQMAELNSLALELGMDVLIEVHNEKELERSLVFQNRLVGINNRNLHNFKVSLDNTINLLKYIPEDRIVVTESGILTRDDVMTMRSHNVNSFLVGEVFMRAEDPGCKLHELFN